MFEREKSERKREELFYDLMASVWHGNIQETVKILSKDPGLVNYRDFTFHLPQKTNSILNYAKALERETIIQVLLGFGAV
ncbi:MAG: hypothetical protein M1429_01005 [Patescibacteria group bacterium]|nr:hypothetical protein [Patescibacteria group bacterium]